MVLIMKKIFKIKGLDCANCAVQLENEINKLEEIENVVINFITEKMTIEYNTDDEKDLIKRIKKIVKREEPDVTIEEF